MFQLGGRNEITPKQIVSLDILIIIYINKDMQRIHMWVSGVVQGVGFRYFTVRKARELGVSGWVRNTPDGRVEIVAEGENWQLENLVESVNTGPSSSSVSRVDVEEEKYQKEFNGFEVRFFIQRYYYSP
jgi:acylphosphatase